VSHDTLDRQCVSKFCCFAASRRSYRPSPKSSTGGLEFLRAIQINLTIPYSYWLRSSSRRRRGKGLRQRRYKPSRLPRCRSCRRIHSINLLRLCNSLHLSITVGPRQPPPASPQCLIQIFLKAAHHQLRPIRLQTFHPTYSHFYKVHSLSNHRQVPHNHLKVQRLCLARTAPSHQHCLQDRCVPRCHRI
jgi:hypothetical protein